LRLGRANLLHLFHRGEVWNVANALAGIGRVDEGDGGPLA
jgi:hypothetical protein